MSTDLSNDVGERAELPGDGGLRAELAATLAQEAALQTELQRLLQRSAELMVQRQSLEDQIAAAVVAPVLKAPQDVTEAAVAGASHAAAVHSGRFLEKGDERGRDHIALASYPRSGNSLLRSLLEQISGILTGSDSLTKRPLIQQLISMGLVGEGVVDERVQFIKTHFPERLGRCTFKARRAIVLVRNPFDAIDSYFNMVLTQTHTHSIRDDEYSKYARIFDVFVRSECEVWKAFHAQWEAAEVPTLWVRYEDLVQHRADTLQRIAAFVHRVEDGFVVPAGWKAAIDELCDAELADSSPYKPRIDLSAISPMEDNTEVPSSGTDDSNVPVESFTGYHAGLQPLHHGRGSGFLKSIEHFTESQRAYVLSSARAELSRFGYWECFPKAWGLCVPHVWPAPGETLPVKRHAMGGCREPQAVLVCNARPPLRPRTKEDPYARGFGVRWRRAVGNLPKPRVIDKRTLPPAGNA